MAELRAVSIALGSAVLIAGCTQAPVPEKQPASAEAPHPTGPEAAAQRLVRQRVGSDDVRFEQARAYSSDGVAVVCGTYATPGRPRQRFVAVSDIDVWVEPEMAPGQMDRAFAEFCRDGAGNA